RSARERLRCVALRDHRGVRTADHHQHAREGEMESDRGSRAVPCPAVDAEPEDQAVEYRDQEEGGAGRGVSNEYLVPSTHVPSSLSSHVGQSASGVAGYASTSLVAMIFLLAACEPLSIATRAESFSMMLC